MIIADTVTVLSREAAGAVLIAGSHCGVYAAHLAARASVRAVILNDAGVGRDRAGIEGLDYLDDLGIAAAALWHNSARIGDGADMAARGIIGHANARAIALGVTSGMAARQALWLLDDRAELSMVTLGGPEQFPAKWTPVERRNCDQTSSPEPRADAIRSEKALAEHRFELAGSVIVVDSASLVEPADAGRIVITGSHGALLGGRPETALKVAALAAVYNDAGVGIDNAGISRLRALDMRGIPAATVSHDSARIGDGRSTLEDGRISHCNARARDCGVRPGLTTWDFIRVIKAGSS
jgi:hypothetical protein